MLNIAPIKMVMTWDAGSYCLNILTTIVYSSRYPRVNLHRCVGGTMGFTLGYHLTVSDFDGFILAKFK